MAIRTYQDDCGMTVRTIQKDDPLALILKNLGTFALGTSQEDDHLALAILKNLVRFALALALLAAIGVVIFVLDELLVTLRTWWEYNGFIQIIIGK